MTLNEDFESYCWYQRPVTVPQAFYKASGTRKVLHQLINYSLRVGTKDEIDQYSNSYIDFYDGFIITSAE